jgi:hypothetical protein
MMAQPEQLSDPKGWRTSYLGRSLPERLDNVERILSEADRLSIGPKSPYNAFWPPFS